MLPMIQCYQCSQLPHGQCDRTSGGDDFTELQGSPSWKQVCLKNLCFQTCFLFQECVLVKARPNTSADRWKIHLHIRPQVNSPFRVPWQDTFTPLCCVVLNSSLDTLSTSSTMIKSSQTVLPIPRSSESEEFRSIAIALILIFHGEPIFPRNCHCLSLVAMMQPALLEVSTFATIAMSLHPPSPPFARD